MRRFEKLNTTSSGLNEFAELFCPVQRRKTSVINALLRTQSLRILTVRNMFGMEKVRMLETNVAKLVVIVRILFVSELAMFRVDFIL